ncbi:amino acid ABC transporter [Pseudomonas sp. v388]|uniref:transporter substrate-binding domain-containing protein n=1 Tax=Pseudomonas sp. v388 TaxID=2479849 RepID=UPI000F78D857|nr:transporter substrate-binding domain-containing protein [Pseudomonas sp. v388]RRV10497.1 amino acid ABC transporter [Pseudomonas sp. v388]
MKTMLKALIIPVTFCASFAHAQGEKTVRIATEGTYPPFSFMESGKLKGFDVDIAEALCEKMKVHCTVQAQDWDGMIPGLVTGKFDAIVASMNMTEERKKKIAFSDRYYSTSSQFVVMKDGGVHDVSPGGLEGKAIGVQVSSVQANYIEAKYPKSEMKQYKTVDDAAMDLANGRIDAILNDSASVYTWIKSKDGECCMLAGEGIKDAAFFGDGKGIGLRQDDPELKAAFNQALNEILADGTFQKINAKYFPFPLY